MNQVDIVCYTSKLCNLRCRYCYEFPLLANPARMSFEQIERMFTHVELGYRDCPEPVGINFQWHGGEPLLIPPDVYRKIFDIQRRVFAGSRHHVQNLIQSNFTVMDEARIALLREFDSVGISLDLFSSLRVNKAGVCQEQRALANLDTVRAAGIAVGGVTVLSRMNLGHMSEIYAFYRERRMPFRVLPLEKGLYVPGQDFELTPRDILQAFCTLADLWLADDSPVPISPLDRFLFAVHHSNSHRDNRVEYHDPAGWLSVLLVDTNGSVYTYGERFERALGNLFNTPLNEILSGPEFQGSVKAAHERMSRTCTSCPYHGKACSGDPIGECQQEFTELTDDGALQCIVARGILQHLEQALVSKGVISRGRTRLTSNILANRVLLPAL